MKNAVIYFAILATVTAIGSRFNLPNLNTETIHTASRAAILAMWLPIFAVITLIPYLPYYAAAHVKSLKIQAPEAQQEQTKCQAIEAVQIEIPAYCSTDPTPVYIGKVYTSIGCNCSVRVKSLKATPRPEAPETLLTPAYILN